MTQPEEVKLIIFDVDGVLTNGSITYDSDGRELKSFFAHDGFALKNAAEITGLKVGLLTARESCIVARRAKELNIQYFEQGCGDKSLGVDRLMQQAGIAPEATAFVGDELIDLPAMQKVGYPIAVANAVDEVKTIARYTTVKSGGNGAARDAIEHLLKADGRWQQVVDAYFTK